MAHRTCSENGCEKSTKGGGRGFCAQHYWRLKYYGTTDAPPPRPDAITRFMSKVIINETGCWIWQAGLTPRGYARFDVGGRRVQAHRWAYEYFVAPVPADLVMDHLCRQHSCVNPLHVEPVTNLENTRRGLCGVLRPPFDHANDALRRGDKAACKQGHPYSGDNLYVSPSGRTHCRACRRAGLAAIRERRRQERLAAGE